MKKILAVLLIVVAMITTACGGSEKSAGTDKKTDFKIGYLASTGHILYFIAQEKGYFAEEGLNSELVLFNNSGEGITAVANGKLDVGAFGSSAPMVYMSKGSPITIFAGQMSMGHALVAKPEKAAELADLKNLKGKTVATIRLATGDIVFREAAIKQGLKIGEDVTFKEMESASAAMEAVKNGAADASVVWTPFRKMAEQQGLKIVKYSPEVPGFENHPCCRQIASTANIQKHPENYEAFLRAMIKAYRFYKTNKDESIEILSKYVNIDKDTLYEETYGKYVESNPDPNRNAVIDFYKYMKEVGYIEKDFDIAEHINIQLYQKALDKLLEAEPQDSIYKQLKADFEKNDL